MIDALFCVNKKFNTTLAACAASEGLVFSSVHRENPHREEPRHLLVAVAGEWGQAVQ